MVNILTIDDDEDFCYAVTRIIRRMGHGAQTAPSIARALERVAETEFDLILLDVGLPDGSGLDLLPTLKSLASAPEVVIITGAGDAQGAELAILNGAWDYLEKSASTKKISLTITRVLQYRTERQKSMEAKGITALKRDAIIGASPRMTQALDKAARAAACDAQVLITGATGTGKELFAKAIHDNGERSGEELVIVDCAALPDNLAENILFGHKKGVYTGAEGNAEGLIQMADKGCLFLDEIGELPLHLQKTLLRVLQEKKFRPLGGRREIKSDFRLISATNRDLDREVEAGRFRKDLLFRIRALHIHLPQLSQRRDDIPKLARHYLDLHCQAQGVDSKGVSSDFFEVLSAYSWPGNVRELANTMEHVVMAALAEPTVFPTHLPPSIRVKVVTSGLRSPSDIKKPGPPEMDAAPLPPLADYRAQILDPHEKKYLMALMARSQDMKSACSVSGLSRSRLYALLKKHNLST